jgi:prepilin-type processing-associated H-X9-DG protein
MVLFPVFGRARESCGPRNSCPSNLKQIGLGLIQYQQDYDEKLPPVDAKMGWVEAVYPYLKSTQLFQCPKEKTAPAAKPSQSGYTDYFFNAQLSRLNLTKLETEPRTLVLAGEGGDGIDIADAHYSRRRFKASWIDEADSPMNRHDGTSNVLFLDGHVKSHRPEAAFVLPFVPELRAATR